MNRAMPNTLKCTTVINAWLGACDRNIKIMNT